MAVFRIDVMARMMSRCLDDAGSLQERNQAAIFRRRPVRPFVELVGIDAKEYDQPDLPGEPPAEPGRAKHNQAKANQKP